MGKQKITFFFIFSILLTSCNISNTKIEKPFLVVVNTLSETLSCLDKYDGSMQINVAKTGQSPNQILQHNNNLYIVNSLSNSITVYDKVDLSIKKEFTTGNGTNPYKMTIVNNTIYVTAYCSHQVIVLSLDGKIQSTIDLEKSGKYYAFPEGITNYGEYIFVACKDSTATTADTCNPNGSRVAVIKDNKVIFYKSLQFSNASNLVVKNDKLFVICSGTFNSGFNEDGAIVEINLSDISSSTEPKVVASNHSFGQLEFANDKAFSGNLGNGQLIKYDTTTLPWTVECNKTFTNKIGLAFISDIKFYNASNCIYATEYNSNKLYKLETNKFEILSEYTCSNNSYADALNLLIIK